MKLKFVKLASIKSHHLMPLSGGLTIKTEYNLSEESSSSNCSPTMVETASPLMRSKVTNNSRLSSPNNYLNSKMLLTPQNLSYFEQRLGRGVGFCDDKKSESLSNSEKHSSSTSLFTIDSILSKQTQRYSDSSPSSSPIHEQPSSNASSYKSGLIDSSPSRASSRLPQSSLFHHHPLQITHLPSSFGSPEFLGKLRVNLDIFICDLAMLSRLLVHQIFHYSQNYPRGIVMF